MEKSAAWGSALYLQHPIYANGGQGGFALKGPEAREAHLSWAHVGALTEG